MFLTTMKDISAFLTHTYYKATYATQVFEIKVKVVAVVKQGQREDSILRR